MRTTKTDEAESDEDDLEEEYRKHGKGVLSFIVVAFESSSFVKVRLSFYYSRVLFLLCRAIKRGRKSNNNYLGFFRVSGYPPYSYTIALFAEQRRDAQTRVRRKDKTT